MLGRLGFEGRHGFVIRIRHFCIWLQAQATQEQYGYGDDRATITSAYQNVNCVLMSIWSLTEPPEALYQYSIFLYTEEQLFPLLVTSEDGGGLTANDAGLNEYALAYCDASTCNAGNR